MSHTLTEFKQMNTTGSNISSSGQGINYQSNGFSTNGFDNNNNNIGRQTAKEFFSKENLMHPVVEENANLKQKLKQLEQAKGMGGAVSLNSLQAEKQKVEQDFQSYQTITQKELKKLRILKQELQRRIDDTRTEIQSERPQSAYSQLSMGGAANNLQNQTMTSNFNQSQLINDVEDLRRQLAEVSVELEDTKDNYKKKLILQQKDMEEYYDQITTFRQEEKSLRVKVNQLEIELEHNLKRLDIICKSKGLPRPKIRSASGTSSTNGRTYVSPYRQNGTSSQNSNNGGVNPRNLSNGSKKASPFTRNNYQYTPPNRRNQSPGNFSNGNNSNTKFRTSPMNNNYINTNYSGNSASQKNNRLNSPGARSNASSGSKSKTTTTTTQNRLYSPSGRIRTNSNGSGSTNMYGSNPTGGAVNRVRRDPAVGGGSSGTQGSRSNSRTRAVDGSFTNNRQNSNQRNNSLTNNKNLTNVQQRKHQSSQVAAYVRQQPSKLQSQQQQLQEKKATSSLFSSKNTNQKSSILDQQKVVSGTIDQKIEKLQSLLKQAKNNYQ